MRLVFPIRPAPGVATAFCVVALAGAVLVAAGCGRTSPAGEYPAKRVPAVAVTYSPPRTIEIPLNALPLAVAAPIELTLGADDSIAVQFMQPTGAQALPRICELSATPDAASRGLIHEPGASRPEVREPEPQAAPVVQRPGAYVPLAMPAVAPSAAHPSAVAEDSPHLPDRPTFDSPAPDERWQPATLTTAVPPVNPPLSLARQEIVPPATYRFAAQTRPTLPARHAPGESQGPTIPDSAALAEQAAALSDQAWRLAQRGLYYSARADLVKSLQLIAQGHDANRGEASHSAALAAALAELGAASYVNGVHPPPEATAIAPFGAADPNRLAGAQSRLAEAAGASAVASQALYRLGRIHSSLAGAGAGPESPHLDQAIVFHQAALIADSGNYLAANELGVLLARAGQLPAARQMLLASVSARPQPESWHNLAVVHRQLGEAELANRAEHERDLLAGQFSAPARAPRAGVVHSAHAKSLPLRRLGDVPWPVDAAPALAASASGPRR